VDIGQKSAMKVEAPNRNVFKGDLENT